MTLRTGEFHSSELGLSSVGDRDSADDDLGTGVEVDVQATISDIFSNDAFEGLVGEIDRLRDEERKKIQQAVGRALVDRMTRMGLFVPQMHHRSVITGYIGLWLERARKAYMEDADFDAMCDGMADPDRLPEFEYCDTRTFLFDYMRIEDPYVRDLLAQTVINAFLRESNGELKDAAKFDGLTGLPVRKVMDDRMDEIEKEDSDGVYVYMMIDLDDFKHKNDTYSHAVGDELLKYAAEQMKRNVRDFRIETARYGGEELIVLIKIADVAEWCDDERLIEKAKERAQEICDAFPSVTFRRTEQPKKNAIGRIVDRLPSVVGRFLERKGITFRKKANSEAVESDINLTASIGVAVGRGSEVKTLAGVADEQMYVAKRGGKNRISCPDKLVGPVVSAVETDVEM